jgi:hypothetical protein
MNENQNLIISNTQNDLVQKSLSDFLISCISQIINKDELLNTVEIELKCRLENQQDPVSINSLIQLLKVLKDSKTMEMSSILSIIKESTKVMIQNNVNTNELNENKSIKNTSISSEDVNNAKNWIEVLKKLANSELSEDELNSIIKE